MPADPDGGLDPFHGPLILPFEGDGEPAAPDPHPDAEAPAPPADQLPTPPREEPPSDSGHDDTDADAEAAAGPGSEAPSDPESDPDPDPDPAPVGIESFTVEAVDACRGGGLLHLVTWTTSGATSATLSVDGGDPEPVGTSGQVERCDPRASPFTLVAFGAGGTAEATQSAG